MSDGVETSDVVFCGPEGRLEGRYVRNAGARAPIALILSSFPQLGCDMTDPVVRMLYAQFANRGFSALQFNFRGIGRSQGTFDQGVGELADAAAGLDWLQALNQDASDCWIAGYGFGAWIGMQLLMRRPEVTGFVSVAPPVNAYDFSFLAPCPVSGLIVHGTRDRIVPKAALDRFVDGLRVQTHCEIRLESVEGADHVFENARDRLARIVGRYLDGHRDDDSDVRTRRKSS